MNQESQKIQNASYSGAREIAFLTPRFYLPKLSAFYARVLDCRAENDQLGYAFKAQVLLETFRALEEQPITQWDEYFTDEDLVKEVLEEAKEFAVLFQKPEYHYLGIHHTLLNIQVRVEALLAKHHAHYG